MDTLHPPLLLVALPHLQDPNFQKSVILLVEHSSEGAMGFIINRPSPIPIRELIAAQEVRIPEHAPAWVGGPVGTDNGLVLHNQPEDASASAVLSDMFSITSSTQALQGLADHARGYELAQGEAFTTEAGPFGPCLYPYRFLVGYAGWGPHQLEEELRLGTWLQLPFDAEIAFNTPWAEIWSTALSRTGINPMTLAPTVHPYLN